ncbi:hypothetical protein [Caballeronia temeraria]|uniref:hypothetical protein n=1 Tax=Caballeronia temeraria TaxID=1777137 RepID=UPI001428CB4C|nr:hypothetical protein [Caballeronia temeraria]
MPKYKVDMMPAATTADKGDQNRTKYLSLRFVIGSSFPEAVVRFKRWRAALAASGEVQIRHRHDIFGRVELQTEREDEI